MSDPERQSSQEQRLLFIGERHTSSKLDAANLCFFYRVSNLGLQLHKLKVLTVTHLIKFYVPVTYVFALSLDHGAFAFVLVAEQDGTETIGPTISQIPAELHTVTQRVIVAEERENVWMLRLEGQTTQLKRNQVVKLETALIMRLVSAR